MPNLRKRNIPVTLRGKSKNIQSIDLFSNATFTKLPSSDKMAKSSVKLHKEKNKSITKGSVLKVSSKELKGLITKEQKISANSVKTIETKSVITELQKDVSIQSYNALMKITNTLNKNRNKRVKRMKASLKKPFAYEGMALDTAKKVMMSKVPSKSNSLANTSRVPVITDRVITNTRCKLLKFKNVTKIPKHITPEVTKTKLDSLLSSTSDLNMMMKDNHKSGTHLSPKRNIRKDVLFNNGESLISSQSSKKNLSTSKLGKVKMFSPALEVKTYKRRAISDSEEKTPKSNVKKKCKMSSKENRLSNDSKDKSSNDILLLNSKTEAKGRNQEIKANKESKKIPGKTNNQNIESKPTDDIFAIKNTSENVTNTKSSYDDYNSKTIGKMSDQVKNAHRKKESLRIKARRKTSSKHLMTQQHALTENKRSVNKRASTRGFKGKIKKDHTSEQCKTTSPHTQNKTARLKDKILSTSNKNVEKVSNISTPNRKSSKTDVLNLIFDLKTISAQLKTASKKRMDMTSQPRSRSGSITKPLVLTRSKIRSLFLSPQQRIETINIEKANSLNDKVVNCALDVSRWKKGTHLVPSKISARESHKGSEKKTYANKKRKNSPVKTNVSIMITTQNDNPKASPDEKEDTHYSVSKTLKSSNIKLREQKTKKVKADKNRMIITLKKSVTDKSEQYAKKSRKKNFLTNVSCDNKNADRLFNSKKSRSRRDFVRQKTANKILTSNSMRSRRSSLFKQNSTSYCTSISELSPPFETMKIHQTKPNLLDETKGQKTSTINKKAYLKSNRRRLSQPQCNAKQLARNVNSDSLKIDNTNTIQSISKKRTTRSHLSGSTITGKLTFPTSKQTKAKNSTKVSKRMLKSDALKILPFPKLSSTDTRKTGGRSLTLSTTPKRNVVSMPTYKITLRSRKVYSDPYPTKAILANNIYIQPKKLAFLTPQPKKSQVKQNVSISSFKHNKYDKPLEPEVIIINNKLSSPKVSRKSRLHLAKSPKPKSKSEKCSSAAASASKGLIAAKSFKPQNLAEHSPLIDKNTALDVSKIQSVYKDSSERELRSAFNDDFVPRTIVSITEMENPHLNVYNVNSNTASTSRCRRTLFHSSERLNNVEKSLEPEQNQKINKKYKSKSSADKGIKTFRHKYVQVSILPSMLNIERIISKVPKGINILSIVRDEWNKKKGEICKFNEIVQIDDLYSSFSSESSRRDSASTFDDATFSTGDERLRILKLKTGKTIEVSNHKATYSPSLGKKRNRRKNVKKTEHQQPFPFADTGAQETNCELFSTSLNNDTVNENLTDRNLLLKNKKDNEAELNDAESDDTKNTENNWKEESNNKKTSFIIENRDINIAINQFQHSPINIDITDNVWPFNRSSKSSVFDKKKNNSVSVLENSNNEIGSVKKDKSTYSENVESAYDTEVLEKPMLEKTQDLKLKKAEKTKKNDKEIITMRHDKDMTDRTNTNKETKSQKEKVTSISFLREKNASFKSKQKKIIRKKQVPAIKAHRVRKELLLSHTFNKVPTKKNKAADTGFVNDNEYERKSEDNSKFDDDTEENDIFLLKAPETENEKETFLNDIKYINEAQSETQPGTIKELFLSIDNTSGKKNLNENSNVLHNSTLTSSEVRHYCDDVDYSDLELNTFSSKLRDSKSVQDSSFKQDSLKQQNQRRKNLKNSTVSKKTISESPELKSLTRNSVFSKSSHDPVEKNDVKNHLATKILTNVGDLIAVSTSSTKTRATNKFISQRKYKTDAKQPDHATINSKNLSTFLTKFNNEKENTSNLNISLSTKPTLRRKRLAVIPYQAQLNLKGYRRGTYLLRERRKQYIVKSRKPKTGTLNFQKGTKNLIQGPQKKICKTISQAETELNVLTPTKEIITEAKTKNSLSHQSKKQISNACNLTDAKKTITIYRTDGVIDNSEEFHLSLPTTSFKVQKTKSMRSPKTLYSKSTGKPSETNRYSRLTKTVQKIRRNKHISENKKSKSLSPAVTNLDKFPDFIHLTRSTARRTGFKNVRSLVYENERSRKASSKRQQMSQLRPISINNKSIPDLIITEPTPMKPKYKDVRWRKKVLNWNNKMSNWQEPTVFFQAPEKLYPTRFDENEVKIKSLVSFTPMTDSHSFTNQQLQDYDRRIVTTPNSEYGRRMLRVLDRKKILGLPFQKKLEDTLSLSRLSDEFSITELNQYKLDDFSNDSIDKDVHYQQREIVDLRKFRFKFKPSDSCIIL